MNKNLYLALIALTVLGLSLSGCQSTVVIPAQNAATAPKLERNCSVYVVTPADGFYGTIHYAASGETVGQAFEHALIKYTSSVVRGSAVTTTDQALEAARNRGCDYIMLPIITQWEDRATEWSGIRDKMRLYVKVFRVKDGMQVHAAEIVGKSAWATFGGDHPQDLVPVPVEEFVASIF